MIHHIFTVYDQKAGAHLPPFILPAIPMAERTFSDCVNKPDHQFGAHPEDYTLLRIGTFDDETAIIDRLDVPEVLGLGTKYREATKFNGVAPNGNASLSNEPPVLRDT